MLSCNLIMRSYKLAGIFMTNAVDPPLRQSIQLTHWTRRHHRMTDGKNSNARENKNDETKTDLCKFIANIMCELSDDGKIRNSVALTFNGIYFILQFFVSFLVRNFWFCRRQYTVRLNVSLRLRYRICLFGCVFASLSRSLGRAVHDSHVYRLLIHVQ